MAAGSFKTIGMIVRDLKQQFPSPFGIRAVGQSNLDHDSIDLVGQRPVQQPTGDEFFVGNHVLLAIPVRDRSRPNPNSRNHAGYIVDGHDITDANRSFEQNDQPSDKVGEHFLQPERQTKCQRRRQPLDLRPLQPDGRTGRDRTRHHNDVADQCSDRVSHRGFNRQLLAGLTSPTVRSRCETIRP